MARARSGWSLPAWLQPKLSPVESLACAAAGDIRAALATAEQAYGSNSPEAAVAVAHAWAVAGDGANAPRALEPALGTRNEAPEREHLQAWLVDARISYHGGDRARGHRSLASALWLAKREHRLPLVLERGWIGPVLRCDPELADVHRRLLGSARRHDQLPGRPGVPEQAAILVVEQLTEREVLRQFSGMLRAAEVAGGLLLWRSFRVMARRCNAQIGDSSHRA